MNGASASRIPGVGPFSPTLREQVERVAQLRGMSTAAFMLLGPDHELWRKLRAGETDPVAFARAHEMVEALPSLRRRQLLATHAAVTWPRPRRAVS
jgi:hypothetical protein